VYSAVTTYESGSLSQPCSPHNELKVKVYWVIPIILQQALLVVKLPLEGVEGMHAGSTGLTWVTSVAL